MLRQAEQKLWQNRHRPQLLRPTFHSPEILLCCRQSAMRCFKVEAGLNFEYAVTAQTSSNRNRRYRPPSFVILKHKPNSTANAIALMQKHMFCGSVDPQPCKKQHAPSEQSVCRGSSQRGLCAEHGRSKDPSQLIGRLTAPNIHMALPLEVSRRQLAAVNRLASWPASQHRPNEHLL